MEKAMFIFLNIFLKFLNIISMIYFFIFLKYVWAQYFFILD